VCGGLNAEAPRIELVAPDDPICSYSPYYWHRRDDGVWAALPNRLATTLAERRRAHGHRSLPLDNNPHSQRTSTGVFQFPADTITDEDAALTWWEQEFAPTCEAVGAQVNAALLVRQIVVSLRRVRETALAETMSLTKAAERTGYSAEHIGRLVRQGRLCEVASTSRTASGSKEVGRIALARLSESLGNKQERVPIADVAAAGGWSDVATLLQCDQQRDEATMLSVMSHPRKILDRVSARN
jgi:hypothetical protein